MLSLSSGYDFGYLIKMLINTDLEEEDENFFSKLKYYCPDIYDVKYLMKSCKDLKGGLQEVSDYLQVADRFNLLFIFIQFKFKTKANLP